MADRGIGRRDVLKAGAGTALAAAAGTPASRVEAQTAPAAPAAPLRPAELVLTNGKIITVDRAFTIASSIAIAGDRILTVGPPEATAPFIAPSTRVVDLKGKAVMPGLIDGHAHMDREGLQERLSGARAGALDQRHPGPHRRARPLARSPANGS